MDDKLRNTIVDITPCIKCTHEEICALKEAHSENLNNLNNLNDVMPFAGMDQISIKCIKYAPYTSSFISRQILDLKESKESGDFRDNCEQFKDK